MAWKHKQAHTIEKTKKKEKEKNSVTVFNEFVLLFRNFNSSLKIYSPEGEGVKALSSPSNR